MKMGEMREEYEIRINAAEKAHDARIEWAKDLPLSFSPMPMLECEHPAWSLPGVLPPL